MLGRAGRKQSSGEASDASQLQPGFELVDMLKDSHRSAAGDERLTEAIGTFQQRTIESERSLSAATSKLPSAMHFLHAAQLRPGSRVHAVAPTAKHSITNATADNLSRGKRQETTGFAFLSASSSLRYDTLNQGLGLLAHTKLLLNQKVKTGCKGTINNLNK